MDLSEFQERIVVHGNIMGVTGLLPVLKPIQETTTLERYRGKKLAIDTYAWLHKASFCCAEDIVLKRPTKAYVNYFNKKIEMLRYFDITPYFVFDGDYLPSKANTEKEREKRREEYKQQAIDAKKKGNSKLAFNFYQKACDISPEMAKSVINELKLKGIKYVVAPYEADSQMVMLEKLGLVDGIISEDSDLLVFGCKTLVTKLNDRGQCIEIKRDNFKHCKGSYINNFSDDQLLLMATISGCDYTKGIPGIGIQKAIALTHSYKTYERIVMSIKVEGKTIPATFEEEFKRARIAFRHQIVFNPQTSRAQHLNPLGEEVVGKYPKEYIQSCTGFILDEEIHKKISTGELDPFTKQVLIPWEAKVNPTMGRSTSLPFSSNATYENNTSKSSVRKFKTEDSSVFGLGEATPITRKRKSAIQIDQFSSFIKKKQEENSNRNRNSGDIKLSPTSKRQRLLSTFEIGQPTISKFFNSHKNEVRKEIQPAEFTASSSDIEDITEEDIVEVNLNLEKNLTASRTQSETSDIVLSDVEASNLTATTRDNEDSSMRSDMDLEDIISSSEVSESTITLDKPINVAAPLSLDRGNSSMSLSTDAGEYNTECYIEAGEAESAHEETRMGSGAGGARGAGDAGEGAPGFDKRNLLAEIYSFDQGPRAHSARTEMEKHEGRVSAARPPTEKSRAAGETWIRRAGGHGNTENHAQHSYQNSRVHRPSPLANRLPLQEVTNNVRVRRVDNASKAGPSKTHGEAARRPLSRFRYVPGE